MLSSFSFEKYEFIALKNIKIKRKSDVSPLHLHAYRRNSMALKVLYNILKRLVNRVPTHYEIKKIALYY